MLTKTLKAVKLATSAMDTDPQVNSPLSELKIVPSPVLHYNNTRTRSFENYEKPEYDFGQIDRILDIEIYVAQAIKKKSALAVKEGWNLVGIKPEHVDYIKARLEQIAWVTKISVEELVDRILTDLIKYSNCALAVVRDSKASGGRVYLDTRTGKRIEPIAGLFPIPMPTLEIKFNKKGQATGYRQKLANSKVLQKKYTKDKVLHFIVNQKGGFSVGTPSITPGVIEDVKALRRIEENVEMLTIQNLFPLVHYKVGTEKMPARVNSRGIDEVAQVVDLINHKPPEGIYVTSERHEIKMIGTEGRALRVESYLDYFKKRVLAGVGLSSVDVGEGDTANRNTADTMSRSMVDEVKSVQRRVERLFQALVITPLLKEANVNIDISKQENLVFLRFREIDIEAKLKKENHAIQQFMQNTITLTEARASMGYNELSEDEWSKSYYKLVVEPQALIGAGAVGAESPASFAAAREGNNPLTEGDITKAQKAKEQIVKTTKKAKAASKPKPTAASKGTISNKARPANQHGTKSAPSRSTKNEFMAQFDDEVSDLRSDILSAGNPKNALHIIGIYQGIARQRITRECRASFYQGAYSVGVPFISTNDERLLFENNRLKSRATKYVDRLFKDIEEAAKAKAITLDSLVTRIDAIHYRLAYISRTEQARSFNWGAIIGLRHLGESLYNIDVNQDSDQNEIAAALRSWPVDEARLKTIPPWHPNSTVRIVRVPNES